MKQNHLIGKASLHFRASRQTDGFALQSEVSNWFWQDVVPELSSVFDSVVPPDVVVRLNQITIELPAVGIVNWKEKLTLAVCRSIAEEITRRRMFPRPTDVPAEEVSPVANTFAAWLYFIQTGHRQISVAPPTEWTTTALNNVSTSPTALSALKQLLQSQPSALERLVRQYDETFLVQLMAAMTGTSAGDVLRWHSAYCGLFSAAWWNKAFGTTANSSSRVKRIFWEMIFQRVSEVNQPEEVFRWVSSHVFPSGQVLR